MFKQFALITILSISTLAISSEERALTRSASGTFYDGKGVAITAHDAARSADTLLNVRLDGFLPVITLNDVDHRLTSEEYVAILKTQELMTLAVQHKLLSGTGSYPELADKQNSLARELTESERAAKLALITKQGAKLKAAQDAITSATGTEAEKIALIFQKQDEIRLAHAAITRAGGSKEKKCVLM